MGGYAVTSVSDLTRMLRKFAAGDVVSVEVYRAGQMKTLTVTLDEKPREEPEESTQPQQNQPETGFWDPFQEFYNRFGG